MPPLKLLRKLKGQINDIILMMLLFLSNFLRLFQVQFRNYNLENIMQDCHNFTRESKTTS